MLKFKKITLECFYSLDTKLDLTFNQE